MRLPFKTIVTVIFILSATLIFVGCAVLKPIGKISVVDSYVHKDMAKPGVKTTHSDNPTITIKAYLTGWVFAHSDILIDQKDPSTPDAYDERIWVPVIAYTIEHPQHGIVVFDFGMGSGDCAYGLRPIYWVPCRNELGADLVSQLTKEHVDPNSMLYYVPSHFHGDHISGLSAMLEFSNARVLVSKVAYDELKAPLRFKSGIVSSMLKTDMNVQLMDKYLVDDPLLGSILDVFGDGTVKIFMTPGHSLGHISVLAEGVDRPVLLTFDASHIEANYNLRIPSGFVASKEAAYDSLDLFKKITASRKNIQIIFGHDPNQWQCKQYPIELGVDEICKSAE